MLTALFKYIHISFCTIPQGACKKAKPVKAGFSFSDLSLNSDIC